MATSDDVLSAVNAMRADLEAVVREVVNAEPRKPGSRITQTEVLRAMLEAQQSRGQVHSSVSISRNARGGKQWEVVVRAGESADVQTAADCARVAQDIDTALTAVYGRDDGGQP